MNSIAPFFFENELCHLSPSLLARKPSFSRVRAPGIPRAAQVGLLPQRYSVRVWHSSRNCCQRGATSAAIAIRGDHLRNSMGGEAYALFLAALLLAGGALGDLYGRCKMFAAGVALFSVASAWCGLAANIRQLILARSLQGTGGALLVPGSLGLISANFGQERRGRAIGTWSGFTPITTTIVPVLGGPEFLKSETRRVLATANGTSGYGAAPPQARRC